MSFCTDAVSWRRKTANTAKHSNSALTRNVSEFESEFECCSNPTIFGKSEIHSVFTGWMPFLPPNQQHQSTEGKQYKLESANSGDALELERLPVHVSSS